jgi:hypothetical protein
VTTSAHDRDDIPVTGLRQGEKPDLVAINGAANGQLAP